MDIRVSSVAASHLVSKSRARDKKSLDQSLDFFFRIGRRIRKARPLLESCLKLHPPFDGGVDSDGDPGTQTGQDGDNVPEVTVTESMIRKHHANRVTLENPQGFSDART